MTDCGHGILPRGDGFGPGAVFVVRQITVPHFTLFAAFRILSAMTWTDPLLLELERRWQHMFSALAAAADVAPSSRLRAEGLMEAAVLAGLSSEEELTRQMDRCYQQATGESLAQRFGADWRDFFPFPQIPAMMQRAPVYPSTRD
jgi:hypothetical protein